MNLLHLNRDLNSFDMQRSFLRCVLVSPIQLAEPASGVRQRQAPVPQPFARRRSRRGGMLLGFLPDLWSDRLDFVGDLSKFSR